MDVGRHNRLGVSPFLSALLQYAAEGVALCAAGGCLQLLSGLPSFRVLQSGGC